ncbi:MAG: NADH-quinone oxidoreductase subunit NuoH [Dehalococcoidales bacterium]|jgi:NADH-quinone oxidoreductase subunit H
MIIFVVILFLFVIFMAMGFIYFERRVISRFQIRIGPNRVGPFGLFQPVADVIKILIKEDIVPLNADKLIHLLAPVAAIVPAIMVFAVIPFQNGAALANLNIGILYIVAISSVSVVGMVMAGWGSNNKYALVSAMRVIAQVVSYEIPLALAIIGVVLFAGTLSMNGIVLAQKIPYILLQPLGFLIYFLGSMAEINRTPFDLLEAEGEIVAGYNIEYSGFKFALFYLTEYTEAIAVSTIITTLYLSGWRGPFDSLPVLPVIWFLIKVFAVFAVIIWVRATLPRLRIDQVMGFAWKCLLPLALINLLITGAQVVFWPNVSQWVFVGVNIVLAGVLIILFSRFFRTTGDKIEA